MSRAFFRAPCRLSVAGGRCLTAGRVLEGPANRPDLGRIVRGAAGMTADLVARVSLKSCELRSSPRPSLATLPLSRESICRSWKARLTGVPDCEPVPWYRFGTECTVLSVQIVHGPGQIGNDGRSEIERRSSPLGWGPKGRWFKSSRPDYFSSTPQAARVPSVPKERRSTSAWLVPAGLEEPLYSEVSRPVHPTRSVVVPQ